MSTNDYILSIDHSDGTNTTYNGYEALLIEDIRRSDLVKKLEIVGLTDEELIEAYQIKLDELSEECEQNLRHRHWRWRETGDRFCWDDDALQMIVGYKKSKRTLYKNLKNGTAELEIILSINEFSKHALRWL